VGIKFGSGLSALLKNFDTDSLIEVLNVLKLLPVDLCVFRSGRMHYTKLGLIPYILHAPLNIAMVVLSKRLLAEFVAVRLLENLLKQELLLPRNQQVNIWCSNFVFEDITSILGQFNIVKSLILQLDQFHIDDLGQEIHRLNELIIEDVGHLLLDGELGL